MRVFQNLPYKFAALLIAALLWAAAHGIRSVENSLDIPVSLEDVPAQVVVVQQSAGELNLRVVGSRAAVRRAERQLIRYPISLRGVEPGEVRFVVDVDRLPMPRGAEIQTWAPSSVSVRLESRTRKRVRVRPDLVGQLPEGYRLLRTEVEPEEVILEGAQSALRRVREALTDPIQLETLRGPSVREVRLSLGSAHIWRADDGGPIRVRFHMELLQDPDDGSGEEADAERRGNGA